jgi:predicted RNA-binding protein with PUA-like domain
MGEEAQMAYWLMKTEPADYSWEQFVADGETRWTGVRNYQAANNMRAMKRGERVFFYRSTVDPAIVGVMRVVKEAYPDPADPTGKFVVVELEPERPVAREVSLKAIKADGRFADLALVRHSRLSVSPIGPEHWAMLADMAGVPA